MTANGPSRPPTAEERRRSSSGASSGLSPPPLLGSASHASCAAVGRSRMRRSPTEQSIVAPATRSALVSPPSVGGKRELGPSSTTCRKAEATPAVPDHSWHAPPKRFMHGSVYFIVRRMSSSEGLLASSRKRRQFIWPRSGFTMIIDPAGYAEAGSDDAPGSATIKTSWRGPLDQMSFPRCWMRRLKACF